jgi:hypothetical protein
MSNGIWSGTTAPSTGNAAQSLYDLVTLFARYVRRLNDIDITQMCGLAKGTDPVTIKTVNPIVFQLYNQQITFGKTDPPSGVDNIPMTPQDQQAESSFCFYLISVNLQGSVIITKGVDNGYFLPSTPPGYASIGVLQVGTDAGYTFTCGTDDLASTGVSATFFDMDCGIAAMCINQAQKRLERGVTIVHDGQQHTIMDFEHMLARAQTTINQGDSTVTLPFPDYKDFDNDGIKITDASSVTYSMEKRDVLPLGLVFQSRPTLISRMPPIETVFTPDGFPAKEFDIWPQADQAYTLDIIVYQYSPSLDGVLYQSNWLTVNAPDVLLFGGLIEYASYYPGDARADEWKARWNDAVWTLYAAQSKEKYSGSQIYPRYKNPLSKCGRGTGLSSNKAGVMSFGMIGD